MNEVAIFVYGLVVFGIVAGACALIGYGIVAERRDHLQLDAEAEAAGAGGTEVATDASGRTDVLPQRAEGVRS